MEQMVVVTFCEFIEEWLDENISEPETVHKNLARKNCFKRAVGLCHSQAACQILYCHGARLREEYGVRAGHLWEYCHFFLPQTLAEVIAYIYIYIQLSGFFGQPLVLLSHLVAPAEPLRGLQRDSECLNQRFE